MRRGLSLLEVLLANFLFLMIILGIFGLLAGTLRLGENSDRWLLAEHHAQQCLERARNQALDDLPLGKAPTQKIDIFTLECEVTAVSGFDQDQLKQVSVQVSWHDHQLRRSLRVCALEDR
jgi:Tfp pilus assembly protein PilV